jgi:hypothetical protein
MTPLEDKLRAAIHATAEEIPADPPPLRLGSPGLTPRRRPRFRLGASRFRPGASRFRPGRRGWNTWLAPLAAAVLVVAVVLGSLAVTRSGSGTATPATPATPAGLPPYYVAVIALSAAAAQSGYVPSAAQVRSTATGAVLATIAAPKPYVGFVAVTAAADDRTFVLDAEGASFSFDRQRQLHNQHPGGAAVYGSPFRLFVLHIDPDPETHSSGVSLRALPASFVPAGQGIGAMALSPDGTSLAVGIPTGSEHVSDLQLTVFNLVTGTRRIWSFDSNGENLPADVLGGLSWTADGQHVAFTGPGASAGSSVLRLLDTSDPGPDALAASKPIPTPAAITNIDEQYTTAIITPDGRTAVFATAVTTTRDGQEMLLRRRILKVSAATGQVTAIVGTPKSLAGKPLDFDWILYSNATGSVLVVSYAQRVTSAWILHGDTYTPIPWNPLTITAAW